MKKNVWYQIEVGQRYENGGFMYYIKINGLQLHAQLNNSPIDLSNKNMGVYVAKFGADTVAEFSKVRNMRFKTERDGDSDWFVVDGTDCWNSCDNTAGACDYCGANGYCCSGDKHGNNGDCTNSMVNAIKNSDFADKNYHMCVAMIEEGSCQDWSYQQETNCPGGDLVDEPMPVKHGLTECQAGVV